MLNIITRINRMLAESCGYLLFFVMAIVAMDIVLRNMGFSIFGIVEVAMYVVVAVVFFGLGHCEENDGHVRITVLLSRLSPKWRFGLRALMAVFSLAIMLLATYACFMSALDSYQSNEAVMASNIALYTWPARAAMFIGMFFYCGQIILSLQNEVTKFRNPPVESDTDPREEK